VGTGRYLFYKVYNYHDSRACYYKRSGILPTIEGMVMEWFWYGYGYGMVLDRDDFGIALGRCVIYSNPICGSHFMEIKFNG
jgi:hypothetical protein